MYINEIEKANDYLKSLVSQSYDSLHTSERFKQEFIAKVNHIENRQYFHRKRKALNIGHNEESSGVERRGRSRSPIERLDPGRIRGLSGIRLPHNVHKNMLKEKGQSLQNISLFNRVSASPEQKRVENSALPKKVAISVPTLTKNELGQKESLEESKVAAEKSEVKVDDKLAENSEAPRLKNGFYDNISFESHDRMQYSKQ